MILKTINTGSHNGNCYVLEQNNEAYILDVGCRIGEVASTHPQLHSKSKITTLVTHGHADHDKFLKEILTHYNTKVICKSSIIMKHYKNDPLFKGLLDTDNENIESITLSHANDSDSKGFLIKDAKFLYLTDFGDNTGNRDKIFHLFENYPIETLLISAVYDADLVQKKIEEKDNKFASHYLERLQIGHFSIQSVISLLGKVTGLKNVILCHVSDNTGDAKKFLKMVKKAYPKLNVSLATKGKSVEL